MMQFDGSKNVNYDFSVVCICGGAGFPHGAASTKRILMLGKCLSSQGIPFHVFHIGPSDYKENASRNGEFEGLTYEYLTPSLRRPSKKVFRVFYYLWGCFQLMFRLLKHRTGSVVYIYYQGDYLNLWSLLLCKILKIPAVQEACEWWPGTLKATYLNNWMYHNIMFRWSVGSIAISHEIQDRIRKLSKLDYSIILVPVLVDQFMLQNSLRLNNFTPINQYIFLWCGMVDGYKRDVIFLIDAFCKIKSPVKNNTILRIVGPCTDSCRDDLMSYAKSNNINPNNIDIPGYVSEEKLSEYCVQAYALLMPLWPDDRSLTRFPTKMGQYLASRRPIVTACVGEIKYFLNGKSAMFYLPGDSNDLASSLDRLLSDSSLCEQLVSQAVQEALPRVDIKTNSARIAKWFSDIYTKFVS